MTEFVPNSEREFEKFSGVILFTGPHGVGKDTLEERFSNGRYKTGRIVRHITRQPVGSESNGKDYFFVSKETFEEIRKQGGFAEAGDFPGVSSGTSFNAINKAVQGNDFATITLTPQDGLILSDELTNMGIENKCLFIGPCPQNIMISNQDEYLSIIRNRILKRARASDHIEGRLVMAGLYRELFMKNIDKVQYIENSHNNLVAALNQINALAENLMTKK